MTAAASEQPRSGRNARRRSREFAVQGLYEWLLAHSEIGVILSGLAQSPGFERCDRTHLDALIKGVIENYQQVHEKLLPHLDRNPEHVSPVERAILMVGTYEMLHHPDIPYRVVISEAIDLAKVFGGTDGYKFVNGVLDKVAGDCGVRQGLR